VNGWQQFVDGDARLAIIVAGDLRGVALRAPALMLLAETQLFGTRARRSGVGGAAWPTGRDPAQSPEP